VTAIGSLTDTLTANGQCAVATSVPCEIRNSTSSGLPTISPTGKPTFKSQTTFGELSFTPRVLLHETRGFSLTSDLTVLVPTGHQPREGKTQLIPGVAISNNFAGRCVIRGGSRDLISLGGGGSDTLLSQLAIGLTLTDHDVPLFGDFTWCVSTVVDTTLAHGQPTSATITPGMRTHLGNDWYFLASLPTSLTTTRIGEIGMTFWFMKAW
jgi:hypothetical protein